MNITEQAATVLQEIDAALAICEKATAGPWEHYHEEMPPSMLCTLSFETVRVKGGGNLFRQSEAANATFIAASRTLLPASLRCLKTAIEGLKWLSLHPDNVIGNKTLTTLINQWNSK